MSTDQPTPPTPRHESQPEWFDQPETNAGQRGLRFECTQCGNCCTGPEGYVLFNDEEARAMAETLGVPLDTFYNDYTHTTPAGRSLKERLTTHGYDCIFLDRTTVPGKALCGVYNARPTQCRTWPFWDANLRTPHHWRHAARTCPGINKGPLIAPEQIRIQRDTTAAR